jgi:hypothetical protein
MKVMWVLLATLFLVIPAHAVVITCVNEGGNVVRIDYNAGDESVLPVAFALDLTVDGGATITSVYDYKVGDSTAASRGFGIFPSSMRVDEKGLVSDWGKPDMSPSGSTGIQPGVGTSGVTIGMASRYSGSENVPLVNGTLCRIRVDMRGAATVNVRVAQNVLGGGVVLENAKPARFTGVGCTLNGSSAPAPPQAPASITYPATSSTGKYTVSWAASTGATSYQLERSANSGSTWTAVYSGAAQSYAETVANGTYRYRVRAANAAGAGNWRTGSGNCVVSIPTQPPLPQPPASLTYPATSSTGKYTVTWPASSGATSYQLERSANAGSTWTAAHSGAALSYAETVTSGTYRYRVRATNTAGSSLWRTSSVNCVVSIPIQPPVPQPPASLTYPSTSSTGKYTVTWPASTGATSCQLERSANAGSTWTAVYSGAALSYAETVSNGTYRYRIRATNAAGAGLWRTGSINCTVSIPSLPLATATVGNTTVFPGISAALNRRAVPYTMAGTGQLRSISIYHSGGSGQMILGVYADSSGRPGARLGVTDTTAVNTVQGWQTVALQGPMSVSAGQRIWLAWVFQNNVGVRATAGTPGRANSIARWSGGMPSAFGSSTVANYIYSVYATYAPESPRDEEDDD